MAVNRYAYWIYVPLIPSIVIIFAFFFKEKWLLKKALILSAFTACLFSILIAFQVSYFGTLLPSFLSSELRGDSMIYWENLLRINPLFFNVFFRDSIFRNALLIFSKSIVSLIMLQVAMHIFSVILFIPVIKLILSCLSVLFNHKKNLLLERKGICFIISSSILIFANLTFLTYGSLKDEPEGYNMLLYPFKYTQVADVRYFSFMLIILTVLLWIAYNIFKWPRWYKYFICSATFLGYIFALICNTAFVSRRLGLEIPRLDRYAHYDEKHIQFFNMLKTNLSKGKGIFLFDNFSKRQKEQDLYYWFLAHRANCIIMNLLDKSKLIDISTTHPIKIFGVINKNTSPVIIDFFEKNRAKKLLTFQSASESEYIIGFDFMP